MPGAVASLIRCYSDPQTPPPVSGETTQKQRDHQSLETRCRDIADVMRKPALAGPETRRAEEQDEVAPHQPYRRAIRCGARPAK
jgi:hypothetical protein